MALRYPEDTAETLLARLAAQRQRMKERKDGDGSSIERTEFEDHFERVMPLPSLRHLHELLEAAFFSSLMTEEREHVLFTLGYISPDLKTDSNWSILRFRDPRPLTPGVIRRLSPALLPESICCAVFPDESDRLLLWGLIFLPRSIGFGESSDLPGVTISSLLPGIIQVRQSGQEIMVDRRGNASFLDEARMHSQSGLQQFLTRLVGSGSFPAPLKAAAQLLRLARVPLRSQHGAILLVVPSGVEPEALSEPPLAADAGSRRVIAEALENPTFESLPDMVARLAFIDGALVMDDALNLIGAGAMIRSPLRSAPDEIQFVLLRPMQIIEAIDVLAPQSIDEFPGSARHRSALEFCYWNPGSVAVVVSQDGVISLMSRHPEQSAVLVLRPFYPSEVELYGGQGSTCLLGD